MKTCENGCPRPALSTWGSAGSQRYRVGHCLIEETHTIKNSGTEMSIFSSSKQEVPASNSIGRK